MIPPPSVPQLSTLLSLRAYYFACFMAMGAFVPFFPGWLREHGFRGLEMSIIMSLTNVMSVGAPPMFGLLADSLGLRGSLLRIASFGATVCFVALAFAVGTGPMIGFPLLFTLCLGGAFFRQPMLMMADVVTLELGVSYGRVRLWGSLGFVVASAMLGRLIVTTERVPLVASIALALALSFAFSLALPKAHAAPPEPVWGEARRLLAGAFFPRFLVAALASQFAHSAYDLCLSLRLHDLGFADHWVGGAWALGALAEIGLMAYAAPLLGRWKLTGWFALATLIGAVRWAILGVVEELWILLPLQVLHAATFGLRWLSALEIVRASAGPNTLATAQGLFLAANSTGAVAGMLMWGPLYESAGAQTVFFAASAIGVVATALALSARQPARA